jgi:hypothetical protein
MRIAFISGSVFWALGRTLNRYGTTLKEGYKGAELMGDNDEDKKGDSKFMLLISTVVILFSLKHCIYDPLTSGRGGTSPSECNHNFEPCR